MRKADSSIVHEGDHARGTEGRASSRPSRQDLAGRVVSFLGAALVAALLALTPVVAPPAAAQLGSPPFMNPPEIGSHQSEKRLRGVIQIVGREFSVPGGKRETYRQYRGWDAAPNASPTPADVVGTSVGPGPTLRARLGDQVQVAFFNKADRNMFPYSYVTESVPGRSSVGCDKVDAVPTDGSKPNTYPMKDIYPNCFHGSSTANIHFHGTHTSPDGVGDNVLVQVMPDHTQRDWLPVFNKVFNTGRVPQKYSDLPLEFRTAQETLVKRYEEEELARAIKNKQPKPEPLSPKNHELIASGQWPQYFVGAFPNFFEIPDYDTGRFKAGQAPGTHWYHAHKHGSTALHIRNGLAGAFVIESSRDGGYDHFIRKTYGWGDKYKEENEKVFVLQQYDPTQNLERQPRIPGARASNTVLVNGKLTPTITMQPGEVQLWRFVNATMGNGAGIVTVGTFASVPFGAADFKVVQTAQDGVQFSQTNYAGQPFLNGAVAPEGLVIAAGNRADLLVQAPTTPTAAPVPFKSGGTSGTTLFFVNVAGAPVKPYPSPLTADKPFPTTWAVMPKFLNDLPVPNTDDPKNWGTTVRFQWEPGRSGPGLNSAGNPPRFMINDKQFEQVGEVVDQCMAQDGLQDWVLENYTTIAHPFHIHVNPFQVLQVNMPADGKVYTPKDNYVWQDVVAIPQAKLNSDGTVTPGSVTIRHAFLDFVGTFVLHCHILAHEDRGMMQLVRVVPAAKYPTACQGPVPAHH